MYHQPFDSVVVLSPFFWNFRDDAWHTTHHVAQEFARLWPTVFVEPNVLWNPRCGSFRGSVLMHSLFGSRTRAAGANLTVFHQRRLPLGRYKVVRNFDARRNSGILSEYLRSMRFQRTLVWHSTPYGSEPFLEAIDNVALAYHCLDYSTQDEETRLIRKADAVFCVSEALVDKHRAVNHRTYLLPNGVDLGLFNFDTIPERPRPADLPKEGPLLGFVGNINSHIDYELLLQVATAFPKTHLIMVGVVAGGGGAPDGRQRVALERLRSSQNVQFLGFKPTKQLATYIYSFDVCLIPFLSDAFNEQCDPLKFYQYSAMGRPIVTTSVVRSATRFPDICYSAGSPDEFVRQVGRALQEPPESPVVQQRLVTARSHSWKVLIGEASKIMTEIAVGRVQLSKA